MARSRPPAGRDPDGGAGGGPDDPPLPTLRKLRGAWSTPVDLVDRIVDAVVTREAVTTATAERRPLRVLDPACGDARFLVAVARRAAQLGIAIEATGVDVDPGAVHRARRELPGARIRYGDALATGGVASAAFGEAERFDLVVGNPPFLSQLAAVTARGGASPHGGGPYADAAVEFLALAARLVEPCGGRVALVLPQSVLSSRDAAPVRRAYSERAAMIWSWWSPEAVFDAQVVTCAVAFEFGRPSPVAARVAGDSWAHVVTARQDVPEVPAGLAGGDGTIGARARLNANFRDEYYGLVPAVTEGGTGPPLVTSGLIDPGRCHWGHRPVRFAKRRWAAPRVDLAALDPRLRRWADERLVPKVLVANQTSVLEAVCDPTGAWLPGVPVVAAYPAAGGAARAWEIAAVLTSPSASVWTWHRQAGTGLSARAIRVGPAVLADVPWPPPTGAVALRRAVAALRVGDVEACGAHVDDAFGVSPAEREPLATWWHDRLARRR